METARRCRQEKGGEDGQWSRFACWPREKKDYTMPSASAAFCLPSPILHTFFLCPAHPTIVTALIHLKFPHFQISNLPLSQSYPVPLSQYSCTLTSLPCLASQYLSSHPPSFPCFSLTLPTAWHPAPQILKLQLSHPPHPTSLTLLLSSWMYFQADFCLPLCNNTSSTTPQ